MSGNIKRTRDVIFVGRLIPEKGAHVLIKALTILGGTATATFVGAGPEATRVGKEIANHGFCHCVRLAGQITGSALANQLNQHRVMVVPSLCHESFGIVALEGIACGCAVVGSDLGGLPEAIGPCGTTFPSGDAKALATVLQQLLSSVPAIKKLHANAAPHLGLHTPIAVARKYLDAFARPTAAT
jgi:glycosyltransferase involved in cell wall biosynthesis